MPNWRKVVVSGSDATLNSLNAVGSLTASGLRYPSADNGEESFIQTNGSGTLSLQYVKTIYEEIYNGEATTIVKGTPVYVSGSVGAAARVFRADASNPSKMPVIYISADTIAAGATGRGIVLGLIKGVDTTGYPAGTEIFVGVGGGWTSIRPTGSAIVQVLGYVTKEGAGGQGVVLNPGPNSLPNLNSGSVWIGNSSGIPVAVATSSIQNVVSSSFATTAITASHALTASSADNFLVRGTLTAQTIVAQVITSSTDFVTGSTRFGSLLSNTHQFTGSVSITGSLTSNGVTTLRGAGTTTGTAITVQNVNSSELFRVLDNATAGFTGSLGVGTLSPQGYNSYDGAGSKLEIRDTVNNLVSVHWRISAQSASIGLQNNRWDFRNSNPVQFTQGGVDTLYLGTNGRVGIGTTSPDTLLQINSTTTTGSTITLNATGTGNSTIRHNRGGVFKFEVGPGGGSDDYGIYNGAASSYSIRIKSTAGGDIYLNETTGSTGIGTTAPVAKLDVNGTANFRGDTVITGSGATSATRALSIVRSNLVPSLIIRNGFADTSTTRFLATFDNFQDTTNYSELLWRSSSIGTAQDITIGSDRVVGGFSNRLNFMTYYANGGQGVQTNMAGYLRSTITTYTATGGVFGSQQSGRGILLLGVYDSDYSSNILHSFDVIRVGKYDTSISGSTTITGSLNVTGGITGSLFGTASWAQNAVTSSYVLNAVSASFAATASFVNPLNQTVIISGSVVVTGSLGMNGNISFSGGDRTITQGSSNSLTIQAGGISISHTNTGLNLQNSFWFGGGAHIWDNVSVSQTNTNPATNGGSVFTISSTRYGTLLTRTDRLSSITGSAQGLLTYITASADEGFYYYNSGSYRGWTRILNNSGSQSISGSLTVSNGITGSLFGTASWALNTVTASYILTAVSASNALTASYVNPLNQNVIVTGSVNVTQAVTASTLLISGSGTQRVTIIGSGSAQPILTVQGSQGELFSITDSLSGSLFSVNDISGLPILEVFSDDTILMGDYTAPSLNTTKRIASTTAGVNVIYSLPTSSYDGVFVDYTIRSGSLGRAGNFMAMWSGSSTDFTDNSINGFGNTTGFVFGASISGSNMVISGSGTTAGWAIKTIIRSI